MKKGTVETDPLKAETDAAEIEPQQLELKLIQPKLKNKKQRHKRDGCNGGSSGKLVDAAEDVLLPIAAALTLVEKSKKRLPGTPQTPIHKKVKSRFPDDAGTGVHRKKQR